jgi:hypothetical protein
VIPGGKAAGAVFIRNRGRAIAVLSFSKLAWRLHRYGDTLGRRVEKLIRLDDLYFMNTRSFLRFAL